jgi:hypothetical protein
MIGVKHALHKEIRMDTKGKNISNDDKRKQMISGLAIGAALGVVFWSALDDLLPFPFDLIVGMGTGLAAGYRWGRQPPAMLMRYPPGVMSRVLISGALFILGFFGYLYLLDLDLSSSQKLFSSLLAILPAIMFICMIAYAIWKLDEMQRRIQTEGIAIAFAGTALVVGIYAILGLAGVPAPHWGMLLVIMMAMWLLGKLWTLWRYR